MKKVSAPGPRLLCGPQRTTAVKTAAKRRRWSRQTQNKRWSDSAEEMAPWVGLEPTTVRLTVGCSTTELPRNRRPANARRPASSTMICGWREGSAGKFPPRNNGRRNDAHFLKRLLFCKCYWCFLRGTMKAAAERRQSATWGPDQP